MEWSGATVTLASHSPTRRFLRLPLLAPSGASPIGEEAVYNAVPQGVDSQRPNLLEIHAAAESKYRVGGAKAAGGV